MLEHPLVRRGVLSTPVHVLALEGRRSTSTLTVHRTKPLPAGSLRAIVIPGIEEPFFVTCPELTLVHMASLLSFPLEVHLGYEMCGTFAPDKQRATGIRSRKPLTSPEKIASHLGKAGGIHGVKQARAALPHILRESASPRESILAELLTLPYAHGGSNVKRPLMNAVVPISARSQRATDRSSLRCDLLWRDKSVALEYDSTLWHTGAERIAEDAVRRNALESLGYTVVTATWKQVANFQEYNRFVRILTGHLGTRVRPSCANYAAKQFELRKELLGQKGAIS